MKNKIKKVIRKKNPEGRPPFYKTALELQKRIDLYFKKGVTLKKVIVGKGDNKDVILVPVPTITGLVLYCGFCDRKAFYDYEAKPEFSYTIKRARTFIEKEYEELLQSGNCTGAIFALKNFGWVDKTEVEVKKAPLTQEEVNEHARMLREAFNIVG